MRFDRMDIQKRSWFQTERNGINIIRVVSARRNFNKKRLKLLPSKVGGYRLEHNFGHGQHNPSHVFAHLAILTLFMDQIVEHWCGKAQQVHEYHPTMKNLW